ncbi:MAG: amidophosphoribosyltransferase [Thermoplasmata archaeon]
MMEKPREKCAVVGIASSSPSRTSSYIYYALRALQHRGQESAGIAVYSRGMKCIKDLGLVGEIFHESNLKKLRGKSGIGHVYYSIRLSRPENAQPHIIDTPSGTMALGHNGIITNSAALKRKMDRKNHDYNLGSEEETIAFMLSDEMAYGLSFPEAMRRVIPNLKGSYSMTFLHDNTVYGLRDPHAIKPLCIGKFDGGHIIASENVAIDVLDGEFIRDVRPGELIELTGKGFKSHQLVESKKKAHCFFEYLYFARADSVLDGKWIYEIRRNIGALLHRLYPVEADVVVPVPDSGRTYALGYSEASGIPVAEGLMKNRYIARTFIMPDQKARDISVREKVNPVKPIIQGKRVILVDDSIVRGTTMRRIVSIMRQAGATEVHVRIGCPPIIAPCYLGIDMTTRDQFIATEKTVEDIAKELGADSVGYDTIEGVVKTLGFKKNELCLGCITELYPVSIPKEMHRFQKKLLDFHFKENS